MAESFVATPERELIEWVALPSASAAKGELFSCIEGWYNPHRHQGTVGDCSLVQFEKRYHEHHRVGSPSRVSGAW